MRDEANRAELPWSPVAANVHPHALCQTSVGGIASGTQTGIVLQEAAFFLPKILLDNPKSET